MLRDYGLVIENGCDDKNQKKWILTNKGHTFCVHLKLMRDLLGPVQKG
jgi:predicted transcriptional regulator